MSDRWYDKMACVGREPAIFEQPMYLNVGRPRKRGYGHKDEWAKLALSICHSCEVRTQCLEEAVRAPDTYHHDDSGLVHVIIPVPMVVGGVLPRHLAELRARRRAAS